MRLVVYLAYLIAHRALRVRRLTVPCASPQTTLVEAACLVSQVFLVTAMLLVRSLVRGDYRILAGCLLSATRLVRLLLALDKVP